MTVGNYFYRGGGSRSEGAKPHALIHFLFLWITCHVDNLNLYFTYFNYFNYFNYFRFTNL